MEYKDSKSVIFRATRFLILLNLCGPILAKPLPVIYLRGAGSTFASRAFLAWMAAYRSYRSQFVDVRMTYDALGSGAGRKAIMGLNPDLQVEYGMSDAPLTDQNYLDYPDLQTLPVIAGAIVIGYKLPGISNLVLTRNQLVGIYNGSVSWWNDTTFQDYNPNVTFPNQRIVPVARYDSSGNTDIFTSALSSISPQWKAQYGEFDVRTKWNQQVVQNFGIRTSGIADTINLQPYRIGYLNPAEAQEVGLLYAEVVNRAGNVIPGSSEAVQVAMNEGSSNLSVRLTGSLVDLPGAYDYPLAGYSYMIVHTRNMTDCATAVELARFIEWIASNDYSKTEAENVEMVPVSPIVADKISANVLEVMTCNGRNVMKLLEKQKYDEAESLKTWKTPVMIISPIIAVIIIAMIGFMMRQKVQYMRMLDKDDWKIDFFQIEFEVPKNRRGPNTEIDHSLPETSHTATIHGSWQGQSIVLNDVAIVRGELEADKKLSQTFMRMKEVVSHNNVVKFYGITLSNSATYFVREYCSRDTLGSMLREDRFNISESLRFALACDVAKGMEFLHKLNIMHGNLRTSSCLVDGKWSVKITDWEYPLIHEKLRRSKYTPYLDKPQFVVHKEWVEEFGSDHQKRSHRMWTPPEIFKLNYQCDPSKAGDVYCFAFILYEIFTSTDPYTDLVKSSEHSTEGELIRPKMNSYIPMKASQIIENAWATESIRRPTFEQIGTLLRRANASGKHNVIDNIIEVLEDCVKEQEDKIAAMTDTGLQVSVNKYLHSRMSETLTDLTKETESGFGTVEHNSSAVLVINIVSSQQDDQDDISEYLKNFTDVVETLLDNAADIYLVEQTAQHLVLLSGSEESDIKTSISSLAEFVLELAQKIKTATISSSRHRSNRNSSGPHLPYFSAGLVCGPVCSAVRWSEVQGLPIQLVLGKAVDQARSLASQPYSSPYRTLLSEQAMRFLEDRYLLSPNNSRVDVLLNADTEQIYQLVGRQTNHKESVA